jgi:hypothetical protein
MTLNTPLVKLSDYFYKEPPSLSEDCIRELRVATSAKKDKSDVFVCWEKKFWNEISKREEVQLENCSNFSFMLSHLGTSKEPNARIVLETFRGKPGFIFTKEKLILNYSKAISFFDKKEPYEKPIQEIYQS